jgi:hypothetical protein
MSKVYGESVLAGGPEQVEERLEQARKACETVVKTQRCPACDSTDLIHIRSKVHCKNCHATLETCCD